MWVSDLIAALGVLALVVVLRALLARLTLPKPRVLEHPIIVDGSNVMHWGGDPSLTVLAKVLAKVQSEGRDPIVYFDANVGYKLGDRYVGADTLARWLDLPPAQVIVAPGRVTADEILLEHAVKDGLRVVTNDRFLDWKTQYPQVGQRGFLIKGRYQQGSVIWREKAAASRSAGG